MKPVLAVDVDGVISLFGFDDPPAKEQARFQLVDGIMHCISLADHYELVWATGWENRANDHLPQMLGLAQLPYLSFDGTARFGSAHWKLGPLDEYCRGRAMAWIDDNLDESCYEWARGRQEPTLLVPTEPDRGLEEAQTEALIGWARGLERERDEPR